MCLLLSGRLLSKLEPKSLCLACAGYSKTASLELNLPRFEPAVMCCVGSKAAGGSQAEAGQGAEEEAGHGGSCQAGSSAQDS